MKRINWRKLLAILTLCALGLTVLAAAPASAEAPAALENEKAISGVLTGNGGGAFAYYTVKYPGDLSVVTTELDYSPADSVVNAAVGFNVYGQNGFVIGQGQGVADTGGAGKLQLSWSDNVPDTWLVQVFNYLPGVDIAYSIMASGLPATSTPAPETTPTSVTTTPTPTEAAQALTASGSLLGNPGGAYAVYHVTVLSGGSDVEVTLNYSPDDPVIGTGVGFTAYGPDGQVHMGTGMGNPGERVTTLPANEPGVYEIQVFNYIDGLTIGYSIHSAPAE